MGAMGATQDEKVYKYQLVPQVDRQYAVLPQSLLCLLRTTASHLYGPRAPPMER
jgi:hypothetical protein